MGKNIKFKLSSRIKDHLIQAFLIFASVYFAFYINNISENRKINRKKNFAIESIRNELYRNSAIIEAWHKRHVQIKEKIEEIGSGKNDSLKSELLKYEFLNLGVLTNNESLIYSLLTNTAWETSKSTGIISEFDFNSTEILANAYSLQYHLTEKTLAGITDFYFSLDAHNMEDIDAILVQFKLRFDELTGQELILKNQYEEAIKSINKALPNNGSYEKD